MRVQRNSQKWNSNCHFCSRKLFLKMLHARRKSSRVSLVSILYSLAIFISSNVQFVESIAIDSSQNLPYTGISQISGGIIQGFLGLNSSSQVSSSTLSSLLSGAGSTSVRAIGKIPTTTEPQTSTVSHTLTQQNSNNVKKDGRKAPTGVSNLLTSFSASAENRRRIKQFFPDSLFAQRGSKLGQRKIRQRARFLVGSLSRQNCFSKVICGLGARPPSTKTDLLNDYVYLMNELMTEDEEKSIEESKDAKTKAVIKAMESKKAKKKPGLSIFTRDDSSDEERKPIPTASDLDDDYNPRLAEIADEELVADDPAILKFMKLEEKKWQKMRPPGFRGGLPPYFYPPPGLSMARFPRISNNVTSNLTSENTPVRRKRQTYHQGPRFFRTSSEMNVNQFISKRRLELQNEKDFKKRLNLAADTGRTLGVRNSRQCRLLFDDCPLDDKQIDSLVVGLRRIIDSNGNITALLTPPSTAKPAAVQAAVDAMQKTAAAAANNPGSKVEIILHLNQNGMPYATQTQGGVINPGPTPSQIPPPPLPPAQGGLGQLPQYVYPTTTTTTTLKPVGEEQLLDFLYGVVNFNKTDEPIQDEQTYEWLMPQMPQKNNRPQSSFKRPRPSVASLDDFIETPLKTRNRIKPLKSSNKDNDPFDLGLDNLFDDDNGSNDGSISADPPNKEEIHALQDYLSSLKETLLGLYQMNNASLAVAANDFLANLGGGKSSEESKESDTKEQGGESEEDFFEIAGEKKKKKGSKDPLKEILGEGDEDSDEKSKEVLLKIKGPGDNKKKKKKGGKTTTEKYTSPEVDDEKDKEVDGDKIFDDDQEDNKAPVKAKVKGKKKKKPEVDDEEEVEEVQQDQVEDEEEDEVEEDAGDEEEDGSDESGEEWEVVGEEEDSDEEEEDEDEPRATGSGSTKKPGKVPLKVQGQGKPNIGKVDPTKITLIFAPSGSGPDKVGSAADDSEFGSEETKKLTQLTKVLLPTAPAPPPLRPKKPIKDVDDKPIVPAAPPVTKEFEKVGNFVKDTKIVNMSQFHEDSPQHPKFHKNYKKKRPSYRNPAAKKKRKNQNRQNGTLAGYQRPGLGRPVAPARPPPPQRQPAASAENEETVQNEEEAEEEYADAQSGESGEAGSSEEEDGEEYEDEEAPYDDLKGGKGKGKKKKKKVQNHIEFGPGEFDEENKFAPGHLPLPGPGPPGIGRLPPKSRDDQSDQSGETGENLKTIIAVPYFRQDMETRFAEGPPPGELATGSVNIGAGGSSLIGSWFSSMMGMQNGHSPEQQQHSGYPHQFGPAFVPGHHRPYIHSYEDIEGRTPTREHSDSREEQSGTGEIRNSSLPLLIHTSSGSSNIEDNEALKPEELSLDALRSELLDDVPQDDKKGKKKKKKGKKKKKKRKKNKGATAVISQVHWTAGTPSLFIEGDGMGPVLSQINQQLKKGFNHLKKKVTGSVLYLPPSVKSRIPAAPLGSPPGPDPPPPTLYPPPPPVPHYGPDSFDGLFDDSSEEDCGGKGKGKKKKGKGRRESRKKKKKKKKKGSKESCEAGWSNEEDKKGDGDKKKDGDKKGGGDGDKKGDDKEKEKRADLEFLAELIANGPLIIDPSQNPDELISSTVSAPTTETPETTTEMARSAFLKSTVAPKPNRYRVTKRPRTPKTTPNILNEDVNDGRPLFMFSTTTEKMITTPRLDVTTLKALVQRPTKRRLLYKSPGGHQDSNKKLGYSVATGPMPGTIYTSMLSSTVRPLIKEDDEQEPSSVHFQPQPGGLHIRNRPPMGIGQLYEESAEVLSEASEVGTAEHPQFAGDDDDEYSDSGERQGRRPLLGFDIRRRPYRHSLTKQQQRLKDIQTFHDSPLPSSVPGYSSAERKKAKGSKSRNKSSTTSTPTAFPNRKKNRNRPQVPTHPGPPHGPPPSGPPPTTSWAGIKNFNIRNLLSRYGNNLLDKTMAAYNNGK